MIRWDSKIVTAPVKVTDCEETTKIDTQTKALIDSGAEGEFINQNYAWSIGMNNIWLKELIPVLNVENTEQTRNDHSLYGIKHDNWQMHMEKTLLHHWIRKAENDLRLYLAQRVKPWYQLANWWNQMATTRRQWGMYVLRSFTISSYRLWTTFSFFA